MSTVSDPFSPPMTRQTSATDSIPVRTPEDELPEFIGRKASLVLGPRIRPASQPRALDRNKSTKQLITRFESLYENPRETAVRKSTIVPPSRGLDHSKTLPPPVTIKKSSTSPIRSSFRNLFSVFKKGKTLKDLPLPSSKDDPSPFGPPTSTAFTGTLLYLTRPSPGNASSDDAFPIWTTCTASIQSTKLVVTWPGLPSDHTINLSQCADVRSLSLRQMPEEDLALLPRPSRGGAHDDPGTVVEDELRIFEVVLGECGTSEKFAATTVQERAGWVSAIWEAVLPSQSEPEMEEPTSTFNQDRDLPPTPTFELPTPISEEQGLPEFGIPASISRVTLYDLPVPEMQILSPLPVHAPNFTSPTFQPGFSSPVERVRSPHVVGFPGGPNSPTPRCLDSPTLSVRSRVQALITSKLDSPSKSASIANLGSKSMVRQRLAQIEPGRSSSPTPLSATRSNTPTNNTTKLTDNALFMPRPAGPIRQDSSRSQVDSIIHSYGDELPPKDHRPSSRFKSTIAVSTTPTKPLFSRTKPTPTIPALQIPLSLTPDPGSASQYSNSALSPLGTGGGTRSSFARGRIPEPSPLGPDVNSFARGGPPTAAQHGGLESQLASLSANVEKLPAQFTSIVSLHARDPLLERVGQSVRAAQEVTSDTGLYVKDMRDMLAEIGEAMRRQNTVVGDRLRENGEEVGDVGKLLTALRDDLKRGIVPRLEEIRDQRARGGRDEGVKSVNVDVVDVVKAAKTSAELALLNERKRAAALADAMALDEVHVKLDGLLKTIREQDVSKRGKAQSAAPGENELVLDELKHISRTLRKDQEQRESQGRQQADGIRYLSELNTWIESFVKNGTGQMQIVSSGVQQLCEQLGTNGEGHSLLAGIHQILKEGKARERDSVSLQAAIDSLVVSVQSQKDSRDVCTRESMVGLMERQRQDQEEMLRTLASDLSNEIRGERLRFVEAMKEATAINIQQHIQDFKSELNREVMSATDTIGRLSMERQVLEQEIASMFDVYAKQKQQMQSQRQAPLMATETKYAQSHSGYAYQTPSTPTYTNVQYPRSVPMPQNGYSR